MSAVESSSFNDLFALYHLLVDETVKKRRAASFGPIRRGRKSVAYAPVYPGQIYPCVGGGDHPVSHRAARRHTYDNAVIGITPTQMMELQRIDYQMQQQKQQQMQHQNRHQNNFIDPAFSSELGTSGHIPVRPVRQHPNPYPNHIPPQLHHQQQQQQHEQPQQQQQQQAQHVQCGYNHPGGYNQVVQFATPLTDGLMTHHPSTSSAGAHGPPTHRPYSNGPGSFRSGRRASEPFLTDGSTQPLFEQVSTLDSA